MGFDLSIRLPLHQVELRMKQDLCQLDLVNFFIFSPNQRKKNASQNNNIYVDAQRQKEILRQIDSETERETHRCSSFCSVSNNNLSI